MFNFYDYKIDPFFYELLGSDVTFSCLLLRRSFVLIGDPVSVSSLFHLCFVASRSCDPPCLTGPALMQVRCDFIGAFSSSVVTCEGGGPRSAFGEWRLGLCALVLCAGLCSAAAAQSKAVSWPLWRRRVLVIAPFNVDLK